MSRWAKFGFPDKLANLPAYMPITGIQLAYYERMSITKGKFCYPEVTINYHTYGGEYEWYRDYSSIAEYLDDLEPILTKKNLATWSDGRMDYDYAGFMDRPPREGSYGRENNNTAFVGKSVLNYYLEEGFANRMAIENGTDFDIDCIGFDGEYETWVQRPYHFRQCVEKLGLGKYLVPPFGDREKQYYEPDKTLASNLIFRTNHEALLLYYKLLNSMRFIPLHYNSGIEIKERVCDADDDITTLPWTTRIVSSFTAESFSSTRRARQTWPTSGLPILERQHFLGREPDHVIYVSHGALSENIRYYPLGTIYVNRSQVHMKKRVVFPVEVPGLVRYGSDDQTPVGPTITSIYGVYDCAGDLQFYDESQTGENPVPCWDTPVRGSLESEQGIRGNGIPLF